MKRNELNLLIAKMQKDGKPFFLKVIIDNYDVEYLKFRMGGLKGDITCVTNYHNIHALLKHERVGKTCNFYGVTKKCLVAIDYFAGKIGHYEIPLTALEFFQHEYEEHKTTDA